MKKVFALLVIVFSSWCLQAQKFDYYKERLRNSGTMGLDRFSVNFESSNSQLNGNFTIYDKEYLTRVLNATMYRGRLTNEARSYYKTGKPRTIIRFQSKETTADSTFREPVLNLPVKYNLNGKTEFWNEDGNICFLLYYENNLLIADSMRISNKVYAISENGLGIKDLSIKNLLYGKDNLAIFRTDVVKLKIPSNNSKYKFNVYDYIYDYLEIDYEDEKKLPTYKAFERVMRKYLMEEKNIHLTVKFEGAQITGMEITDEISKKERAVLLKHFAASIKAVSIKINDMNCKAGTIEVYFTRGGC